MPTYFLINVASILITLALISQASNKPTTWTALIFSLGFAHYLVSLVYARRQFLELARQPNLFVPLFSAVILGAGLYLSYFPLLIYFALHHAFNTVYVLNHTIPVDNDDVRAFRGSAVLLHLFLYFVLLRHGIASDFGHTGSFYLMLLQRNELYLPLLLAGLAIAYVAFFYYLYRLRSFLSLPVLIENCAFELLGLAAMAASFYVRFTFLQVVLYHFVFWTLFPLPKMYALGSSKLLSYIGLTTLCIAGFLLVSPIGSFSSQVHPSTFRTQFLLWSYIHITASFVLSNAHPKWIVGLFRPSLVGGEAGQRARSPAPAFSTPVTVRDTGRESQGALRH